MVFKHPAAIIAYPIEGAMVYLSTVREVMDWATQDKCSFHIAMQGMRVFVLSSKRDEMYPRFKWTVDVNGNLADEIWIDFLYRYDLDVVDWWYDDSEEIDEVYLAPMIKKRRLKKLTRRT